MLEESIYSALVLATRDYIQKNSFEGALIGLSGGVDSALTLAIAVDAVGSGGSDERDMWALALHQEKESVAVAHRRSV